jgi:shikimate dehydrogenase
VLTCLRLGAGRVAIFNRTETRAKRLASRFADHHVKRDGRHEREIIEAHGLGDLASSGHLAHAAVIINATSIGLQGDGFPNLDYAATSAECLFYDLIYAREPTPFLQPAMALGRRALDGAGMLANQGELAFELFNGVPAPPGLMRRTLMAALGRNRDQDIEKG